MLIRVRGRIDGVKQYLEEGQMQDRELHRDVLDARVMLHGDLELCDEILHSIAKTSERYLSIILSFREDEVSRDILTNIVDEFKAFAMSAYRDEEYHLFAEAHLPKVKSYTNQKNGAFIERKPHIHVVIPTMNLLTGQKLNPFGKFKHNEAFVNAFQEHMNAKYGLASPKDHRRVEFTSASEMISRYKGDVFTGANKALRETILNGILERNITTTKEFETYLATFGDVRVRNTGKDNEYFNVTQTGEKKGVNLKDAVFLREFIALSAEDKKSRLSQAVQAKYEATTDPVATSPRYLEQLNEWHQRRALEVKYLNSGNRALYQRYKNADTAERQQILQGRADAFYQKHQPRFIVKTPKLDRPKAAPTLLSEAPTLATAKLSAVKQLTRLERQLHIKTQRFYNDYAKEIHHGQKTLGRGRLRDGRQGGGHSDFRQSHLSETRTLAATPTLHDVRNLSSVNLVHDTHRNPVLLPRDAPHHLRFGQSGHADHRVRRPRRVGGRTKQLKPIRLSANPDNTLHQLRRELRDAVREAKGGRNPVYAEIKLNLKADFLLKELAHTHGVIQNKYEITAGKDGSDRILCGKRHLNVSDFLTKELNLSWEESSLILRDTYALQRTRHPEIPLRLTPSQEMWQTFKAYQRTTLKERHEKQWEEQRIREATRRDELKSSFNQLREALYQQRLDVGDRKARMSILKMQKAAQANALLHQSQQERAQLRQSQRGPYREVYKDYLTDMANAGNEAALAELRRMQSRAPAPSKPPFVSTVQENQAAANDSLFSHVTYHVKRTGEVVYKLRGTEALNDVGREVRLLQDDIATMELALRFSQQKFGMTLRVNGSEDFKTRMALIAAQRNIRVSFTDQAMQKVYEDQQLRQFELKTDKQSAVIKDADLRVWQYRGTILRVGDQYVYQEFGSDIIRHLRSNMPPDIKAGQRVLVEYGKKKVNVERDKDSGLER